MKVVNVCETPLLASEVYSLMRQNPRNALAFDARDPLENPDITDPDELRRLVASRRSVAYLENCLSIEDIKADQLPRVVGVMRSFGLTTDQIARLTDSAVLTASTDASGLIYLTKILGDSASRFSQEQLEKLRTALQVLTGKAVAEALEVCPPVEEEPPSAKRRSRRR